MCLFLAVPYFILPLRNQYADSAGNLTWRCEASGEPAVTYSWLKNGVGFNSTSIPPEDRGRITISNNVVTINNLNAERDDGMYQCAAYNVHGTTYSTAELKVLSK